MKQTAQRWGSTLACVGALLAAPSTHAAGGKGGARKEGPRAPPAAAPVGSAAAPELKGEAAVLAVQVLELSRAPATQVVPYLSSPEGRVRARAALALGRLQDWSVADNIIPLLGDPDPEVRRASAFALGELDPVMPLLLAQIKAGRKGDDPAVKGPALARAAAEKKVDARLHLEERGDVRRALYGALGPLAVGAGLHHLQFGLDAGPDEAGWAARAIGVHGHRRGREAVQDKEILDALHKLLDSPREDTRFGATYALFRIGARDVPGLSERLGTDPDARVRISAARGLSGKKGGEDALVASLRDPDWRVRVQGIRGLAAAEKPRGLSSREDVAAIAQVSLEALRVVLGSTGTQGAPMAHVVITAADALAGAPPALAMPPLDALAEMLGVPGSAGAAAASAPASTRKPEETWRLRCAVAAALDRASGTPQRVKACGMPGEPAWWAVARELDVVARIPGSDAEKARRLGAFLNHDVPQVRALAAGALADLDAIKAPDAAVLVAERLAEEQDPVTAAALAGALRDRANAAQAPYLRKALGRFSGKPGDASLAAASVAQVLGAAGVTEAAADIRPLLQAPFARDRALAAAALGQLGEPTVPAPVPPPLKPERPENLPGRVTLKTSRGDVVLRLYRDDAPLTVTHFVGLARRGFYKGIPFHRVVSDFVVQGGDPRGDGNGGPGLVIPCEYNPRPYDRGVVGMALDGKDSGGSQFFITHSPQPHLDGNYTAFAEVESGMDVVDALQVGDVLLDVVAN